MKIVNGLLCPRCHKEIEVINNGNIVSHGRCIECLKKIPLPKENFKSFTEKHCIEINKINEVDELYITYSFEDC